LSINYKYKVHYIFIIVMAICLQIIELRSSTNNSDILVSISNSMPHNRVKKVDEIKKHFIMGYSDFSLYDVLLDKFSSHA
jgi:hypothetical protein